MVRVLSVYHFQNQKTKSIESDVVDFTIINDAKLVLAKINGFIEIYDLSTDEIDCVTSFITIDDIISVQFCLQGHYLVCLEQKVLKGRSTCRSVRVYCNFDQKDHDALGINARIAGKVNCLCFDMCR